jgi:uncharacterized membrane protein YvbJ
MTSCPKCNASVSDEDKECGACGIFFNKWREREDNVAMGNMTRYQAIANATSSEFNWTILIVVCVALAGAIYLIGQRANSLN